MTYSDILMGVYRSPISFIRSGFQSLRSRPWLMAYALVIEAAFQFLLKAWSEPAEVLLSVAIFGAFLLVTLFVKGPKGLWSTLTDTWTQRFAALFLLGVATSFLWGDHSTRSILALLRLPTYLVIIAMVTETVKVKERIPSFAWMILGVISVLFVLSLIEFYFGSDVVGLKCADIAKCLEFKGENWHWKGLLHYSTNISEFARHGGTLNATVIGEGYGTARLGLFAILACALGTGLILTSGRKLPKVSAAGLIIMVLFVLVISGSRSGTLAILIAFIVFTALFILNARSWLRVMLFAVISLVIFATTLLLLLVLPTGATSFDRMFASTPARPDLIPYKPDFIPYKPDFIPYKPDFIPYKPDLINRYEGYLGISLDHGRTRNWTLAMELFAENPVGGSGFRTFQREARARFPDTRIIGVHSGYFKVLSESGLLGMIPFLALLGYTLFVMLHRVPGLPDTIIVWQAVFFSALIGMLAINVVSTLSTDRFFWVALGFASGIEIWSRQKLFLDKGANAGERF